MRVWEAVEATEERRCVRMPTVVLDDRPRPCGLPAAWRTLSRRAQVWLHYCEGHRRVLDDLDRQRQEAA